MSSPHSLLPRSSAMKRILVFMQPGMEAVVAASPLIGDTNGFIGPVPLLGRLVMNSKHALWFETLDGERIHLAKAPEGRRKPK